jgi:uncharacterized MAPEG superfamily protein
MSSPIERMNDYKGSSLPSPVIPLSGLAFSVVLPYFILMITPQGWSSLNPTESILLFLQTFSLASILFLVEFLFGVKARGTSKKASFSPAAAQASGVAPFQVVQSNRIHQNHIESACIYVPAALAAAAAGADARLIVATAVTWVASRALYRMGYCQENSFWRIFGVAASMNQSLACLGLFLYSKVQ